LSFELPIEADYKLGFGYSRNAQFAERDAMRCDRACSIAEPRPPAEHLKKKRCCLNVGCTQIPSRAKACWGIVRSFSKLEGANCRGPYVESLKRLALGSCDACVVGDSTRRQSNIIGGAEHGLD